MSYPGGVREGGQDHLDLIVEQWKRERPDVGVEALAVVGRLLRTAELADVRLAEGLRDHRLSAGWFDVLAALRRAGPPYELTPTELRHAMMLSSGGVTKRLDRLVTAGLVSRRPDPDDRRGVIVRLTARGRRSVDRALVQHVANEEELLAPLSPRERQALNRLLRRLLTALEGERSSR
jgi:DNA-binding MarR family transcriptional regulator